MRGFFSQALGPGLLSTTIISVIVFGHRFGCKHSKWTFFPSCSRPDIPQPEDLPRGVDPPRPISVTCISAKVFDNPALLRVNYDFG
jgi:hypothetical protein